ncbi:MAG: FprA family A-type flavoprotein [Lachnospiraceae bacterium]
MYCTRQITEDITWIGGSDRRLARFENLFPLPHGVSYNAYVIMDEKTAILDTVDHAIAKQFMENVAHVLKGRALDYLIVNHMEPDHCASIGELLFQYPDMKIVGNQKTIQFLGQFFDADMSDRTIVVTEKERLALGKHTLQFVMAPMVHWPETMVTYELATGTLFSADAFGTFGALDGTIFHDELEQDTDWIVEARRYYTNIVGKYGVQVQTLLKKASSLEIKTICPLHGPIWREHLEEYMQLYDKWSRYEPEVQGVLIAYASMYGNTENAANVLAAGLADAGITKIAVRDVSVTDISYLIGEAFKYSHIVLAAPTYNGNIYAMMEHFIQDMQALNLQHRTFTLIENGTWAPMAGKQMMSMLETIKNTTILEHTISLKSTLKPSDEEGMEQVMKDIVKTLTC